jgi:clorobiocin biosynthesis protein CloN5
VTDRVTEQVIAFIRTTFLDGDPRGELDERTPLLEWGVLNSLKMAQLLTFLRDGLEPADRVRVPALEITGPNFRTVRSIAALVDRLPRT